MKKRIRFGIRLPIFTNLATFVFYMEESAAVKFAENISNAAMLLQMAGQGNLAEGERFWTDQFERLLRYCIDTAKLSGRALTVDLLRKIQLSAAKTPAQLAEDGWKQKSTCWHCLREAEARLDTKEIEEADFDRILHFWMTDYLTLDPEPRSTVDLPCCRNGQCRDRY